MGHEAPDGRKDFVNLLDFSKKEASPGAGEDSSGAGDRGQPREPDPKKDPTLELMLGSRYLQTFSVILVSTAFVILGYYPSSYFPLEAQVLLMFAGGLLLLLFAIYLYRDEEEFRLYAKSLIFGGVKIEYTALWSLHFHYDLVSLELFGFLVVLMLVVHYYLSLRYHSELLNVSAILIWFVLATILHSNGVLDDWVYLLVLVGATLANIALGYYRKSPTIVFAPIPYLFAWFLFHAFATGTVVFNLSFGKIDDHSALAAVYSLILIIYLPLLYQLYNENSMLALVLPKDGLPGLLSKVKAFYVPFIILFGATGPLVFRDNASFGLFIFSFALYGVMRVRFAREYGRSANVFLFHISLFMALLFSLLFAAHGEGLEGGIVRFYDLFGSREVILDRIDVVYPLFTLTIFFILGGLFYADVRYWLRDFGKLCLDLEKLVLALWEKGEKGVLAPEWPTREEDVSRKIRSFIWGYMVLSGLLLAYVFPALDMDSYFQISFLFFLALGFEIVLHIRQISTIEVYSSYLVFLFSLTLAALVSSGLRPVAVLAIPAILIYLLYSELVNHGKDSRNLVVLALFWLLISGYFIREFHYPIYLLLLGATAFLVLRWDGLADVFQNMDRPFMDATFGKEGDLGQDDRNSKTGTRPLSITWQRSHLRTYLYRFRKHRLLSFWKLGLSLILLNGFLGMELYFKRGHELAGGEWLDQAHLSSYTWEFLCLFVFLLLPALLFLVSYLSIEGRRGRIILPTLVLIFSLPTIPRYGFSFEPILFFLFLMGVLLLYERHVSDELLLSYPFIFFMVAFISRVFGYFEPGYPPLWGLLVLCIALTLIFFDHVRHVAQIGLILITSFILFSSVSTLDGEAAIYPLGVFFILLLFFLFVSPVVPKLYPGLYQQYFRKLDPFRDRDPSKFGLADRRAYFQRTRFEQEKGSEERVLFLLIAYFYVFLIVFPYVGEVGVWEAISANTLLMVFLVVNLLRWRGRDGFGAGDRNRDGTRKVQVSGDESSEPEQDISYTQLLLLLSPALLVTGFMEFAILKFYFLALFSFGFVFFLWDGTKHEREVSEFVLVATVSIAYFSALHSVVEGWNDLLEPYSIIFDIPLLCLVFYYLLFVFGYLRTERFDTGILESLRARFFHPKKRDYPWHLTLFVLVTLTSVPMSYGILLVPLAIFLYSLFKKDFLNFAVAYVAMLFVSYYLVTKYLNFADLHARMLVMVLAFLFLPVGIINEKKISGEPVTFASGFVSACLMLAVPFILPEFIYTTGFWVLYWGVAFSAGLYLDKRYMRFCGLFYFFLGLFKLIYDVNDIGVERAVLGLLLFGVMGSVSAYFYIKHKKRIDGALLV